MPAYQETLAIWAGDVFFDVYEAGVRTGERDVGHAPEFLINAPTLEKKEETGRRRQNYGETIKSIVTKTEQMFKTTIKDINRHNLAVAMLGEDVVYSQAAGDNTASPESVTARAGRWVKLAARNLDPGNPPVVQDDTDTTTYVENTDYEIDYQVGRIYVPESGSSIADEDVLHVASTWLQHTGYKVLANTDMTKEIAVRVIGYDKANDRNGELLIHKARIEPSGDLAWINEEFMSVEVTGEILRTSDGFWEAYVYE